MAYIILRYMIYHIVLTMNSAEYVGCRKKSIQEIDHVSAELICAWL